jgi:pantothenate kinase
MSEPPPPRNRPAHPALLAAMVKRVLALERVPSATTRAIVGIVGAPGSGKSTLAAAVVTALGPTAALVGLDGFHLAQRVLDDRGLAEVKGAPETFDADGYLNLLTRLRKPPDGRTIYAPEFRREIEEPIAGAIAVPPTAEVIITEGNYLLLDTAPWAGVRAVASEVWFLDTPEDLRVRRLIERHIRYGRSPEAARERAESGSDARNAALVLASREHADVLLQP